MAPLCAWPLLVFGRLGAEFVPQLDEGSFATHMIRTTSIGLDASIAMQKRAEKVLIERIPRRCLHLLAHRHSGSRDRPDGRQRRGHLHHSTSRSKNGAKINGKALTKDELANRMSAELGSAGAGPGVPVLAAH